MSVIRDARRSERDEIFAIINDGASAYRGVIPEDRWREPYMPMEVLEEEIRAGVRFYCFTEEEKILGVMGVQDKGQVVLIRHAYVRTTARRQGIGAQLLSALIQKTEKPILIGTWKAAQWAIDFYQKHGFSLLPDNQAQALLQKFWSVPARQMETSAVLVDRRFMVQKENATGWIT